MKVNAIRTNLVGTNFASRRKEAPEGYEWARDYGCPEDGSFLRKKVDKCNCEGRANECEHRAIEKNKEKNPINIAPEGYAPYFTYDGKCVYIPVKK